MLNKIRIILEMIKFEHTIFALPFAFTGALLAARGLPAWSTILWIVVAMVGARSAAMGFNRWADRAFDAENPRTSMRALPLGLVTPAQVILFTAVSSALLIYAAYRLNTLSFVLSPVALAVVFFYSYTKRFTFLSHAFLGLAICLAPIGSWIAVTGKIEAPALVLGAAVLFWLLGFDVLYALQDMDFDRKAGLHSIPQRFGIRAVALDLPGLARHHDGCALLAVRAALAPLVLSRRRDHSAMPDHLRAYPGQGGRSFKAEYGFFQYERLHQRYDLRVHAARCSAVDPAR